MRVAGKKTSGGYLGSRATTSSVEAEGKENQHHQSKTEDQEEKRKGVGRRQQLLLLKCIHGCSGTGRSPRQRSRFPAAWLLFLNYLFLGSILFQKLALVIAQEDQSAGGADEEQDITKHFMAKFGKIKGDKFVQDKPVVFPHGLYIGPPHSGEKEDVPQLAPDNLAGKLPQNKTEEEECRRVCDFFRTSDREIDEEGLRCMCKVQHEARRLEEQRLLL